MKVDVLKEQFIPKYLEAGEHKFYRFLLTYALNKLVAIEKGTYGGEYPSLEFLDYYERFMALFRKEGDVVFLKMASLFRKAGHKIYRIMLKKEMTPINSRFLNRIK